MKVVVTGGDGMLAQAFARTAAEQGHEAVRLGRRALDVTDAAAVDAAIASARPDAVLHCAAYTNVDDAELNEEEAFAVNANGAANVARAAARARAWFVYPSTDYVFAGTKDRPYRADDATDPLNAYGRSKLAGEQAASRFAEHHLIVRPSGLYGAGGRNFVGTILQRARTGEPLRVVNDQQGSPTWTRDVANVVFRLLEAGAPAGVYHACNTGVTTWYGLACAALQLAGVETLVTPVTTAEFPRRANRPSYSVLDCSETTALVGQMRPWRAALAAAIAEGV